MLDWLLLFLAGFFSAMFGVMGGGGAGGIQFFLLLYLGVPLPVAIGTHKFGDLGFYPLSLKNFNHAKKIKLKKSLLVVFLAILGGLFGSLFTISLENDSLKLIIGILLSLILIFILANNKIGIKSRKERKIWIPSYFTACFYNGMVGVGGGALSVFSLTAFRGMKFIEAGALSFFGNMFLGTISTFIFFVNGLILWKFGLILFLGNLLGGHVGSKIILKGGDSWMRFFLSAILVATVIKLLFF